MSDYLARAKEVAALVLDFVTSSQKAEQSARNLLLPAPPPDVDPLATTMSPQQVESAGVERAQFQDKVWPYFDARNKTMQQLAAVEILDSSDDDFTPKWKQPADALSSTYASTLGSLLSGISNPTQTAVVLKSKIQTGEDLFVKSLAALPMADQWSLLRKWNRQLLSSIASLRTRWDSVVSKSREINQAALDVVARLDSKYQAALRGTAGDWSDAVSAMHDACDILNAAAGSSSLSGSDVDTALAAASASIDKMTQPLANVWNAYRDALSELQSGIPALTGFQSAELDGVHKVLQDIRKEVTDYVRTPPSDSAKSAVSSTVDFLARWASQQIDGSKTDANDFCNDLLRKEYAMRDEILKNWDTFDKENRGRFFDTISSDRLNTLLFQNEWKAAKTFLVEPGNIDSPRFAEAQIANFFSQPLEQAYNNLVAAVSDKVDESSREAVKARAELGRDAVIGQYDSRTDAVRATLSAVYDLVKTDNYRNLFDRPQMESSLKSS